MRNKNKSINKSKIENEKISAMKAVYSYYFPETKAVVNSLNIPDEIFYVSHSIKEMQKSLYDNGIIIKIPKDWSSEEVLDNLHEPLIEKNIQKYSKIIKGLENFPYKYWTSGSSEGIFHLLAETSASGIKTVHTLDGEYEGYKEYGKSLDIDTLEHSIYAALEIKNSSWFISNPSARDGNIISDEYINKIADNDNKIVLDLAYVGSTKKNMFDVSHENITSVVMSFSKPYGLFRHRIGFAFSKEPIQSLYGNKWFKDIGRLLLAYKIAKDIGPESLYNKYDITQQSIIHDLNIKYDLNLHPSDSLLTAYAYEDELSDREKILLKDYKRADNYRLCLTPYYECYEKIGG